MIGCGPTLCLEIDAIYCPAVGGSQELAAAIREHLLSAWPHRFRPEQLGNDASLGSDGLGLDSVELAELVLTCEELTGRASTSRLLEETPLTIRRLVDHFVSMAV